MPSVISSVVKKFVLTNNTENVVKVQLRLTEKPGQKANFLMPKSTFTVVINPSATMQFLNLIKIDRTQEWGEFDYTFNVLGGKYGAKKDAPSIAEKMESHNIDTTRN